MYNTSIAQYGNDFLISNNEVFLSHAFAMEYIKVILFMFLIGFTMGASLVSVFFLYHDDIRDVINRVKTKYLYV